MARFSSEYYASIGRNGGKRKNSAKGFGTHRKLAASAGRKGGSVRRS